MRIYVCIKHVPDTAADITICPDHSFTTNSKFVINPYDEFAIEEAKRIKNSVADCEVICVSIGGNDSEDALRRALASCADRGIFIKLNYGFVDSIITASLLKTAIEADGKADLILTGRSSSDFEGGQTMYHLADALNMPVVNDICKLDLFEEKIVVEKEIESGARQLIEVKLPCVVGAAKGLNTPSYPKLPEILKARNKVIVQLNANELIFPPIQYTSNLNRIEAIKERSAAKILNGPSHQIVSDIVKILRKVENVI